MCVVSIIKQRERPVDPCRGLRDVIKRGIVEGVCISWFVCGVPADQAASRNGVARFVQQRGSDGERREQRAREVSSSHVTPECCA